MIMATIESVRKNASSSSNAISGAGMLPFITPTSMVWRGSTWPVRHWAGGLGLVHAFGAGPKVTDGAELDHTPVKAMSTLVTTPPTTVATPWAVMPPGGGALKVTDGSP